MTITARCPECENKLWRGKRCDTESCPRYTDRIDEPNYDTNGIVTVGDLREELDGLSDDTLVAVTASGAWNFAYTISHDSVGPSGKSVLMLDEHKPLFDD